MTQTLIIRHRRENKKKCSLQPLVGCEGFDFLTYPLKEAISDFSPYIMLSLDAEIPLSEKDAGKQILLLDATWRYADQMQKVILGDQKIEKRSLPKHFVTAYPRRQPDCEKPDQGLASIEALYIAYRILKRPCDFLLENYHFKEHFLELNASKF